MERRSFLKGLSTVFFPLVLPAKALEPILKLSRKPIWVPEVVQPWRIEYVGTVLTFDKSLAGHWKAEEVVLAETTGHGYGSCPSLPSEVAPVHFEKSGVVDAVVFTGPAGAPLRVPIEMFDWRQGENRHVWTQDEVRIGSLTLATTKAPVPEVQGKKSLRSQWLHG